MASKYAFKTSPVGEAQYPYLTKPDFEYEEDGKYSVKLILEQNEKTMELCEALDEALDEHIENMKIQTRKKKLKVPGTMYEVDEDEGTVTLNINMKRIAGAKGKEFEKSIKFFDAKGKYVGTNKSEAEDELPAIYPGSRIAVNMRLFTWLNGAEVGIRLEPEAVQLVKLAKAQARSAKDYGFGEYDEGFEDEDEDDNGFSDQSNEVDDEEDDDEFV